jgi:flagellar hook-associated protein 3 FlgL
MLGRVTQTMLNRRLVDDLGGLNQRMADSQQKISTGKQINQPSDDPLGTQRALGLRTSLEGTQQYSRNVDAASGWLGTTDDALAQVSDIVQRARELTIQGASDSNGPDARNSIALEIDQLIGALKQNANANYQGAYVFAGTATTTPPYTTASDAYQGDAGVVARSIGPGVSVQVNTLGSQLLGSGQAAADGKLFDTLRTIADHLRSGLTVDQDALRTTDLQKLETNFDALSQARASVGAVMSRTQSAKSRLSDVELTTTKLLSNTEDVDITKAIIDLSNQQNTYQAALRSGAAIIQPSLLDFLH